jgi:O-antigen/teichoic acid export membrane protein
MKNNLKSSLIFKSAIASADQAMLSALNFLISIILIKTVSRIEYGYYSIGFSIILLVISLQNAIINAPLAVLLPQKKSICKGQYVSSLCFGQYIAILPAAALCLLISFLLMFHGFNATLISIVMSLCFAVFGILLREFLRSLFFAKQKAVQVLKLDLLYVSIFVASIAITFLLFPISAWKIIFLMGLSALIVGVFFCREIDRNLQFYHIKESYSENWQFGKWALLGVIVTHMQNYSYLYLLGSMIGSEAVADVSAARLLLMPMVFVQTGWHKVVVPHGSFLREQKRIELFFKQLIIVSVIVVIGISIYIAILFQFSDILQNYLLGEKYSTAFDYIFLWGIIFAVQFILGNAGSGLVVMKEFYVVTKFSLVSMPITIVCAYFLIERLSILGGLIALIIGATLLAVCLWVTFSKSVFSKKSNDLTKRSRKKLILKLSK